MEEKKRYPVLIVGATFTGIGAACRRKDAVIVERTGFVGEEFTASYKQARINGQLALAAEAETLRNEAIARNIAVDDEGIHWPAFVPVMHRLIAEKKVNVRFLTRIIEVNPVGSGGYEVLLADVSGLSKVLSDTVIDSTSMCESSPAAAVGHVYGRCLNAIVYRPDEPGSIPPSVDGYKLYRGRFASEWAVSCPIEPGSNWAQARAQLLEHWGRRPELLKPWHLAAIADSYDVAVEAGPHDVASGWVWLPSASYEDPIAAYDAGIRIATEVSL